MTETKVFVTIDRVSGHLRVWANREDAERWADPRYEVVETPLLHLVDDRVSVAGVKGVAA